MIEVCIIGFGFSAIPLVRELERTKTDYQIISADNDSVWDKLDKSGNLDFNLVSSYQTSFYSFDLVKNYEKDYYPTGKQFYEMHKRWRAVYEDRIIRDFVVKIDNFKDHSLITTSSGRILEAKSVVIATGFGRQMNSFLNDFDFNVSNKTFVLGGMGDSANLILAKLIPNNNKVIIRGNGFMPLDQQNNIWGKRFTLDQTEAHNFRYISHEKYNELIMGPTNNKSTNPSLLWNQFPLIKRDCSWKKGHSDNSSPGHGLVWIKYWPIDEYCRNFGADLEGSISKGYLLNDIAMWLHTGKVILVPPDTPIDFENKSVTYAGIERRFDQYIKGDAEKPRLPEILIDGVTPYEYLYRDNFMGVIPQNLNNIYLLGYTRPLTGGLANITEMQSLFIHKLLTQPKFHSHIHHNLSERITAYNQYYYGNSEPFKTDHTILYGFYTEDIARLIGIDHKLSECKSLKDLIFYYAFPNNAYKYRLKGEYAIDGIEELIEKVNRDYDNYISIFVLFLNAGYIKTENLAEWLHKSKHFLFNDMRYKEEYRAFLDDYINAYRRVKNISVDESVDEEWDSMVSEACKVRDRVATAVEDNIDDSFDNDTFTAVKLVSSLIESSDGDYSKYIKSELDSKRIHVIKSLWEPVEYDLPYLCD
ncbi:thioredoxin reductase [Rivularia sp. PCC 7116]|uniref:thioredoxin reductase n=1 Tax=Rivularia sp. PCC 7116 TaxID=373994 RepID=UPI00029F2387|nr:thioredoxin reductase [Rivularia sp. PCC 7116]AFY54212.1 thioredoxin reductase [Rivularia sp. PCC 7116]